MWNPTYELTQFNFSLDLANDWRVRQGLSRNKDWDDVRMNLAPLPITTAGPSGKPTYNRHQVQRQANASMEAAPTCRTSTLCSLRPVFDCLYWLGVMG